VHPALLQAGAALFRTGVQSFRLVAGLLGASSLWALAACASPGRRRGAALGVVRVLVMSSGCGLGYAFSLTPALPMNLPAPSLISKDLQPGGSKAAIAAVGGPLVLSRWEREAARRLHVLLGRTLKPHRGRRFSLAQRERVGVREKGWDLTHRPLVLRLR